jgi:signal transduction histidine kinase
MEEQKVQKLIERIADLEHKLRETTAELHHKNRALEIEAALEKVRARTINMRTSSELSETSATLFQELNDLGIQTIRTGVGIFDDAHEAMDHWVTTMAGDHQVMRVLDYFSLHINPVFEKLIAARKQGNQYELTILRGDQVRDYYQSLHTYLAQSSNQFYHQEEFFYSFFFPQGTLNVNTSRALTEEEISIVIGFARVLGLIYTRFLDVQEAESKTLEARRQSSLERIRAEIASMRTAKDLERITPFMWQELANLDVEFTRCGIFIVDEEKRVVHAYLSTPQGKSLGVLHLPFDGTDTTRKIVENWKARTVYRESWDRQQFEAWVQSMAEQGQITEVETYQASDTPIDFLRLHFTPFSQGMLYVGSIEYSAQVFSDRMHGPQDDVVKSLADAFSVAYARYEDFKRLDDTKNHLEATLSELKATQSQLIHSEKMASLGELTAGIAHEIQNPLNFINNFSELNKELLTEMNEEIEKENFNEIKSIANNIVENEDKILHHGKRADGIVKGMLQHSRTSSGVKGPTNINALADEYTRLAYQGLRAKDKSFNATVNTNFDENVGNINIIPQDIGRVILNLITNAFYAVSAKASDYAKASLDKSATANGSYEPTVTVSTRRSTSGGVGRGEIEIRVKDNGIGIPQSVLDKIFQPFFTTKPPGQGTGLGLSMSYDIVKAHGGQLNVETKESEGSEFIIVLPQ